MIALDLDGTLADSFGALTLYTCAQLKLSPTDLTAREAFDYHDLVSHYPVNLQPQAAEIAGRAYAGLEGHVYADAAVYPGAQETVAWLHARKLVKGYVTRRPAAVKGVTKVWLKQRGFPTLPIKFCADGSGKSESVKALRASTLIEDSPMEAQEVKNAGYSVILLDRPYNRVPLDLVRASSWGAVLTLMKHLPLDHREKYERGF